MNPLEELFKHREEIDKIDDEILQAFKERMSLAEKIAAVKQNGNLFVTDNARETAVIEKARNKMPPDLKDDAEVLMKTIMALSRKKQHNCLDGKMKNIVLIGMPASGKTAVGMALAEKLGYEFLDIDGEIEKTAGKAISKIFSEKGESFFRILEKDETQKAAKANKTIISTGGGIVLDSESIKELKESGTIIFLNRSIENIKNADHSLRPLLRENGNEIYALYEQRRHLYKKYADFVIDNNGDIAKTINNICEVLNEITCDKRP